MDAMGMSDSMGSDLSTPLTTAGVDLSNSTQASDFLSAILNDDQLKEVGNYYARCFWYGVVVVIGITSLFHWTRWMTLQSRHKAAARKQDSPAKPRNILERWLATTTAMGREMSYLQYTPTHRLKWFRIPPMGTILLVLTHFSCLMALEYTNNNVQGAKFWQARGVRAGWLAVAQMPLIILLVGRHNLIGLLTGTSYERLNVLHRWSARLMLLMACMHFGYQMTGWNEYDLVVLEWTTDTCPPTGIAAFALLLWMNLTTLAPFRFWSYEFFVIQHLLTFVGFIVAIMYHLPTTATWSRIYIYIPIALYCIDRLIRTALFAWRNMRLSRATITVLDGGATKIRFSNRAVKYWNAGSYVKLSIPRFGYWQSHPATILSTPTSHDGDMVFILKSHKGFTRRLMNGANNSTTTLLPHSKREVDLEQNAQVATYAALINGPYGGSQDKFTAFDSVCLIAGSTGITFTLSLLQSIAEDAANTDNTIPLRRVHFVWIVKETGWVNWAKDEIAAAVAKLGEAAVEVEVSVYVTCAEIYTDDQGAVEKECGCACDKSLGPCCCVVVDEDGEGLQETGTDDIAQAKQDGEKGEKNDEATVTEKRGSASSSNSSQVETGKDAGTRLSVLPCAAFYSGRPEVYEILGKLLDGANGESGVAVCGPIGLSTAVRNNVVRLSDQRAIHKGSGAQGLYLHAESFS